ncbi:type II toxin-antitoxin system VapB family antitoxin [Streptomyces sp. NPDC059627]
MSRTVIDLGDQLVADVAKALGTGTKKETANTTLREVLAPRRAPTAAERRQGIEDLRLLFGRVPIDDSRCPVLLRRHRPGHPWLW